MSFEEEFDSIIRRKAEGENYPFDESNWEKTSALLDAERGASRALKIKQLYLPVVLVLAIGAASVMTYNYFDSVKGTTSTAKELSVITNANSTDLKNETPLTEGSSSSLNATAKEENPNTSLAIPANEKSKNTNENVEPAVTKDVPDNTKINSKATTNSTTGIKENKISKSQNETTLNSKKEDFVASTASKKESANGKQITDKAEQFASDTNEGITSESASTKQVTVEKTETAKVPASSKEVTEQMTQTTQPETENSNILPASSALETNLLVNADQLIAVYSTLPLEITDQDLNSGTFVYLDRYDDDYYKKKNAKTDYLNVEFGANYLLGWNAVKGKDGEGMNWYAGFNYGRYFGNKFNVNIGLQAYNIANIKQPFYLVAAKEYGFGSNLIYTRVTSNELYYVAVPLNFNYMLNSKNSIGLGVNAAYLIGATSTVSKYYTLDNELRTVGPSDTQTKGIYKGTNMMNVMLSANYKTQLVKRVRLNVEFNYGLSDMFKNTELVKTNERPVGIRVGLIYTIFDK